MTTYTLNQVSGLSADTLVMLLRTHYDGEPDSAIRFASARYSEKLVSQLRDTWNTVEPLTIDNANDLFFSRSPLYRRLFFWALRPEKFFPAHIDELKLLAEFTDSITEPVWDKEGNESQRTRERVYKLYKVPAETLAVDRESWFSIGVIRCSCPSTNKEHWILMSLSNENDPERYRRQIFQHLYAPLLLERKRLERIYRQGDLIIGRVLDRDSNESAHEVKFQSLIYSEA